MNLGYILKLGLKICLSNIKAQKINIFILKTIKMVLANFFIEDKIKRHWIFYKTLLFLTFRNANIKFA